MHYAPAHLIPEEEQYYCVMCGEVLYWMNGVWYIPETTIKFHGGGNRHTSEEKKRRKKEYKEERDRKKLARSKRLYHSNPGGRNREGWG